MSSYRLYRREPIKAGKTYYAVDCKGCKVPIYILDDRSEGKAPVTFAGPGLLLIPCLKCRHDDIYGVEEVSTRYAEEDEPGARPKRAATSGSPRQPFWKKHPNSKAIFGVGYIEDRPHAAAIVARIVTGWSDIEIQCARLLAELMGTNIPQAAAVFGSMRNSRQQHLALQAVADVDLDERDLELFDAHMIRKGQLESERNDLAHGCFGVCLDAPDDVVWVSQIDFLLFMANNAEGGHSEESFEAFRKKQFIYSIGTLERIAQEVEEFYNQLSFLIGYLFARRGGGGGDVFRAKRYGQLCEQPHINEALIALRSRK